MMGGSHPCLTNDKQILYRQMEAINDSGEDTDMVINLANSWKSADYHCKKSVAMIMIHKIMISEDGNAQIIWNI
jgi:hypothetical protein